MKEDRRGTGHSGPALNPRRDKGMYMRMLFEPVAMGIDAVDAARAAVGYAQG
jgi:hypothetical protein